MISSKGIAFKVHPPMEFLYSLFALGTGKHYYDMIKDFELEPKEELIHSINNMKNGLSRYMEQELEYFFDLNGLGYIFYKYILANEKIDNVLELLTIFKESPAEELALHIVTSVCKNVIPQINSDEFNELKANLNKMLDLVENTTFQEEERKLRVVDALENPEEIKQRFYLLLSQFYNKCYRVVESDILSLLSKEKEKFKKLFNEDPEQFLDKYLSLNSINYEAVTFVHLSFFKYVSWHHYSIYNEDHADWFVLGVYTDMLFDKNLITEKLSAYFKALSDTNRIEILKLLLERPWFGQELAEKLNITPATVSYHMGFLQQIGAVTFKRADNRSYYLLNSSKLIKPLEDFVTYFKTN
jgi:DNA-binding transcriptional ArsR family regulator